jgi:hypothetical protein
MLVRVTHRMRISCSWGPPSRGSSSTECRRQRDSRFGNHHSDRTRLDPSRSCPLLQTFAEHLASDAKKLVENDETGAKSYRYVRTGTNHYSLAFTYDWIASENERRHYDGFIWFGDDDDDHPTPMQELMRAMRNEGCEWPPRWNKIF